MLAGEILTLDDLRVNAGDADLFIVRPVEYADAAALRHGAPVAPQVVVVQLLVGGLFEVDHVKAHGIDAAGDVFDRAVLPSRIHALEDHQHRVAVVGVQSFLQLGEPLDVGDDLLLRVWQHLPQRGVRCQLGVRRILEFPDVDAHLEPNVPSARGAPGCAVRATLTTAMRDVEQQTHRR